MKKQKGLFGYWTILANIWVLLGVLYCVTPTDVLTVPDKAALSANTPTLTTVMVYVTPDTLIVGDSLKSTAQACAFLVYSNGMVAMRTQDAAMCGTKYVNTFPAFERKVSPSLQRQADLQCIQFRSSDPAIASVTSETCPLV